MKRLSYALLALLAVPHYAGAEAQTPQIDADATPSQFTGGAIAAFRECRFLALSGDYSEERLEMTAPRRELIFALLRDTNVGRLVIAELERFMASGLGGDASKRLRLFEVARDQGPEAEYFENGELHINSRVFEGLTPGADSYTSTHFTAASFIVHEATHAIAHHLYLTGEFAPYQANTKVNEALAYFLQGLYLDEIRERVKGYQETRATASWDRCTVRIVGILKDYGIDQDSQADDVYDQLTERQLEADEATALRLSKLWQYYQFLKQSEEADGLWRLDAAHLPKEKVVEKVTDMIWLDVERRNCDFDNTFSLMGNRIILYAHYADTPPSTTSCEYFRGFVTALRSEGNVSQLLRDEIDKWLIRRGLGSEQNKGEQP